MGLEFLCSFPQSAFPGPLFMAEVCVPGSKGAPHTNDGQVMWDAGQGGHALSACHRGSSSLSETKEENRLGWRSRETSPPGFPRQTGRRCNLDLLERDTQRETPRKVQRGG